ncbi:MAG: hypothetical protein RLO51_16085 [Thalassobaculum sp.]|uniref:hypothetical protein n=1 Tax=Thalassobaculum sp. TaxID=2022740 RepID=UPI0032EB3AD3
MPVRVATVVLWAAIAASAPMAAATAGEADVVGVEIRAEGPGLWRFDVAVRHDDTGWDHYADRWDVVGPDGAVLGTRVLLHPHETEQPFTRSLSGVAVPDGVAEVTVRAHDKVHGYGGKVMTVRLPR